MARSRYVEQKNQINQALRAVRRAYRMADSAGEKLERSLDRLIARKTAVYADQLISTTGLYKEYNNKVQSVDSAIAQLLTIAAY